MITVNASIAYVMNKPNDIKLTLSLGVGIILVVGKQSNC